MHEKETILDKMGRVISVAGNGILMNLLFLVSCIPVVTMGQAWAALLTAIRYQIRGDKWFEGYKTGFKRRFWRGTILGCIMLAVNVYFLLDVRYAYQAMETVPDATVPFIAACVMFALSAAVTVGWQLLNVYVPTPVGDWLRNGVNMVFKVPVELVVAAGLYWLPVLLLVFNGHQIFWYFSIIFLAAYYTIAAAVITLLMKNALIRYLVQARADGTLLAEEGANAQKKDEA